MFDRVPQINKTVGSVLGPVLDLVHLRLHLTPNHLSCISFGIGTGAVIAILFHQIIMAVSLIAVSLFFDGLDGSTARRFHLESDFGRRLDMYLDRTNEFILMLALVLAGYTPLLITLLAIAAITLVSSVKDRSRFDPGFKRIIIILGYWIGFPLALNLIFLVNLSGYIVSLCILDLQLQRQLDKEN